MVEYRPANALIPNATTSARLSHMSYLRNRLYANMLNSMKYNTPFFCDSHTTTESVRSMPVARDSCPATCRKEAPYGTDKKSSGSLGWRRARRVSYRRDRGV